jgi:hypothetical protein
LEREQWAKGGQGPPWAVVPGNGLIDMSSNRRMIDE